MRKALGTTLAALRAYKRSGGRRPASAEASWARLAERSRVGLGAHIALTAAGLSGGAPGSRVWRSLVALGAAMMLVAAGLLAIFLGASELGQRAQQGPPYASVDPSAAAPAVSGRATPVSNAATGSAPAGPLPAAGVAGGPLPSAALATPTPSSAVMGAPVMTNTPVAPGSPSAAGSPSANGSPSLLELCRVVVAAGNGWPSVIKRADRETLIAAAGGKKKDVLPYCTALTA